MKKTMKIEGMMCAHCEATVKKALEAIPEVVDAEVSHTAGTAVVTLQSPVDDAALKKAVEDKYYTPAMHSRVHARNQGQWMAYLKRIALKSVFSSFSSK